MAAEFYHVVGIRGAGVYDAFCPSSCYLGKTTDLLFKVEPEKTIDCDDGTTVVGSEKLTLSFSMLDRIDRPQNRIDQLLLIPHVPLQTGAVAGKEVLTVDLLGEHGLNEEVKSGEFEKTHFSYTWRYASGNAPYTLSDAFFDNYIVILATGIGANQYLWIGSPDEDPPLRIAADEPSARLISTQAALIGGIEALRDALNSFGYDFYIYAGDRKLDFYTGNKKGVRVYQLG